mgnify:CR=1 FL=1
MRTYLLLALGMILFGSATPVSKLVVAEVSPYLGSLVRVAIGAVVLLPFAWPERHRLAEFGTRDWIATAAIAVFGMFGFSVLLLEGMDRISGVHGAIVMATTPAVTGTAAVLFLGERASRRRVFALGLAVAGVAFTQLTRAGGVEPGGHLFLGAALVFGAVCAEACYTLLGRQMSVEASPVLIACLAAALSIPLFLPFAWGAFGQLAGLDAGGWAALVWYGAGTLALGTALWYAGLVRSEGSVAAGFMGLMPVSALVLSYILLGEPFRWLHLAGFAIVFAGVLLMAREHAAQSG